MYSQLTDVASNVTFAVDDIVIAPNAELEDFIQAPDDQLTAWEEMTANITMNTTTTMPPIILSTFTYDTIDDDDLLGDFEGSGSTIFAEVSAAVDSFNTLPDFSEIDALLAEPSPPAALIDHKNMPEDLSGAVACGLMLCLLFAVLGWTSRRQRQSAHNEQY